MHRFSPDLLDITTINLLESLRTSHDLSLPLGLADDTPIEIKLRVGIEETAGRALEVAEEQAAFRGDSGDAESGRIYGEAVEHLLSLRQEVILGDKGIVWEDAVSRTLQLVHSSMSYFIFDTWLIDPPGSSTFGSAFADAIFGADSSHANPTLSVIRSSVASECGIDTRKALQVLLDDLMTVGRE